MSDVRFLESIENLTRVVRESTGRTPDLEITRQISSCLQQGRLFFESASKSGQEIRPLLLSYGTIAYARAVIVARTLTKLEQQPHAHGLKDISQGNSLLKDLRIRIVGDGTFQRIVNVAREIERTAIIEDTQTVWIRSPTCSSADLDKREVSLNDIFSRVLDLRDIYRETFASDPDVILAMPFQRLGEEHIYDWQIDIRSQTTPSAENIFNLIQELRARFPFLNQLSFLEAWFAWDHIGIRFDNCSPAGRYPADSTQIRTDARPGHFLPINQGYDGNPPIPMASVLSSASGGLIGNQWPTFMSPLFGVYLSELAVLYLGTYLLGSLVRYRPQVWVHALYGHSTEEHPRDDSALSLIHRFLDIVDKKVSDWAIAAIRARPI